MRRLLVSCLIFARRILSACLVLARPLLAFLLIAALLLPEWAFAAAAHRSDSATTYGSRTNTTCTAPAGIQNGDVLLLVFDVAAATNAPSPTAPSGFAAVAGTWPIDLRDLGFNVDVYVWYKVASGESGNYTVTHSAASSQCYIKAVSGGSSSQPASTTNSNTEGSTTTALSITPSGNDALVMFVSSDWGDTANALSPPSGTTPTFTERLDPGTTSGILYVADGVLGTAGATGDKSITNNNNAGGPLSPWAGVLVVVEASGGAAPDVSQFRKRVVQ